MAYSMALMIWLYILQAERRYQEAPWKAQRRNATKGYYKILKAKKKGRSSEFTGIAFRH